MIPGNRLAILLDHVKQNQINQCLYHNTASPPSLYSDHMCDRADFPLQTTIELCQHRDEVWYCEFSHDGTKLVTAGRDHNVIIYDTSTFEVIHKLADHDDGVAQAIWSPDDTRLITCSQDKKARVWCAEVRTTHCFLPLYPNVLITNSRVAVLQLSTITENPSRLPPGLQMESLLSRRLWTWKLNSATGTCADRLSMCGLEDSVFKTVPSVQTGVDWSLLTLRAKSTYTTCRHTKKNTACR